MMLSIIVAADENNVIGKQGGMAWHLPDDFKNFKATTIGHPIIMGRKTYDSIGKPLPGRLNIVVSRNADLHIDGCMVVSSLHDALDMAKREGTDEAFVIGGGQLYELATPLADRLYLTRVHTHLEGGDTHFPVISDTEWRRTKCERHEPDERHLFAFTFEVYERKK